MPIRPEIVKELLNDALQELEEINERKLHLDELVDKLRKCLPKQSVLPLSTPDSKAQKLLTSITKDVAQTGRRRKISHATKTAEIVRESAGKLKIHDVIKAYHDRGWKISSSESNAYTTIFRAIKGRPDLLKLTRDGYVKLAIQGQASFQEVTK